MPREQERKRRLNNLAGKSMTPAHSVLFQLQYALAFSKVTTCKSGLMRTPVPM